MPDLSPLEQDVLGFIDKISGNFDIIGSLKYLVIAAILLVVLRRVYNRHKLKPDEARKGADLHAGIVNVLDKIYLAYRKKGVKLEKKYPKKSDIHVLEHNKFVFNAWLIRPNSLHRIRQGDVGRVYVHRLFIWRKEDRTRVAALLAAWWFNIYYYALQNQPLGALDYAVDPRKLGRLRRISEDTLKLAGLGYLAEPKAATTIDVVKLLMDNAKIEHEHRRIARIEHDEIQRIEELRKEDERAYGTMADVHKVGKAMIHHLNNLMHLGRKQLRLLKEDARIRQELGEANADSDYNALLQDILRMGGIIDWLQSNVNVMRGDKKMQKELDRRLEEFDRLVLDVSSRLRHLDMILELGDRLEPIPESAFH